MSFVRRALAVGLSGKGFLPGILAVGLAACGGGAAQSPGTGSANAQEQSVSLLPTVHAQAVTQPQAITPAQAALAQWSPVITLPLVPVTGAVLANGKLEFMSADAPNDILYQHSLFTYTALFDPVALTSTLVDTTSSSQDMFCPATARLPDGRILVDGGDTSGASSLYDPVANAWSAGPALNFPRGYDASAPLPDGSVLTFGGSWAATGTKPAERFTVANGWQALTGISTTDASFLTNDAAGLFRADNHMWLIPTANGKLLHAGPARQMHWLDVNANGGTGGYTAAGSRADDTDSMNGNAVMYDAGKILTVGGSINYDNTNSKTSAFIIDTTQGNASVARISPMAYPRLFHNSVVLPNGQVIVLGGQTYSIAFSDSYGVLPAELFDPVTQSFTTLAASSVARNYHSIGLLLLDGRVVSAGGGLCACAGDHENLQILSPPYLFNADGSAATRPVILSAPATVGYGTTMTVTTNSPINAFSMVRLGAATHTVNNDQRRLPLNILSSSGNTYQLAVPTNPGLLLPGQWMLFAMNAQGTPSVANVVLVSNSGAPTLANPGNVTTTAGSSINVPVTASTPSGTLAYSAVGLPAGLSIDPVAGIIGGTPVVSGNYLATIQASNGTQTVSSDMVFYLTVPGTGTGLEAQYFSGTTFAGTATQKLETPNQTYTVAAGATSPGMSVRWLGFLKAPATGSGKIQFVSTQGARLWFGGQLVIDSTGPTPTPDTATITFTANQQYALMIEYINATGTGSIALNWQPPGATNLLPITAANLYPAAVPSSTNIALNKTATQSSSNPYDNGGGLAPLAVDGNTDGTLADGSVSLSGDAAPQDWWQVDLGTSSRVDVVQIWNLLNPAISDMQNFYVFVAPYNMTNSTLAQLQADPTVSARLVPANSLLAPMIGVPVGAAGRYLRVQLAGNGYVELAEVQVFGAPGSPPALTAVVNQQSVVGTAVTANVTATDPAGTALTYSAGGLPAGLAIGATSGVISGSATAVGAANVTVTVTDALGLSSQTSFTWTVLNVIPTVTTLPAPVVKSGTTVSFNPTLTAGATSTYSWNFGDGSAATAFSSAAATSHTFANPGVYTVTLTIQTADGRSSTQTFLQAVYPAGASALASASSDMLLEIRSGSSARIWVVNQDNNSVSVFDAVSFAKLAEIPVGASPRTVARAANGSLWVTNHAGASISVVSASSLSVTQTIALPRASQPYGIVFSPVDGSAFVTLEATGQLLKLNTSGATTATLAVGANIRHLAMSAAGDRLLVSQFITPPLPGEGAATVQTVNASGGNVGGQVFVVAPAALTLSSTVTLQYSNKPDSDIQGSGVPNYLGAAAISPDNTTAWVPSKQDDIARGTLRSGINLNFESVRAESSRINLTTLIEDYPSRIDHDFAGFASAAVYHPTGAYLFVALETSRQVAVVDPAGKRELFRINVGLAPRGVVVSPDGLTLYVSNFMSRTVSVVNLTPLVSFGQSNLTASQTLTAVATDNLAANVLRGKQLFYDAADPRLARASFMSCAVCHNDGTFDGRTWDFTGLGEGLRNTIALNGRAGMGEGFLHWSANFDEDQDFEGQIRSFAGGSGLMNNADFNVGTRSQPLGLPKAGISPDLDALAAYLASLNTFPQDPYRNADGTLSPSAQLGKDVFQTNNCASCHGSLPFTDSGNASQLKNIGTLNAAAGTRLGGPLPGIDIPTLRDVWATGPYLHDGSAPTISAAIMAHSGVALSATDLANVAEYVREIGTEEFVAGAIGCAAGDPGTCIVPANTVATVYYGTAGIGFLSLAGQSGSVSCAIATFGGTDPAPGYAKSCSYVVTGVVAASAGIICGQQGELCVIPSGVVATVNYGSNGAFASQAGMTGSVACNAATFGASAPTSSGNACNYTVTSVALPPAATACGTSSGTCTLPTGMVATVNYGANGVYFSKSGVTGSIACNDATFGDPLPNVTKNCSYVVTSAGTATGTGLLGQYFGNVSLSGTPALQRVEVPNFIWPNDTAPAPGLPADYFGVRWTGTVEAPTSGTAVLATASDDGVRVWFDGKLVIDDWADHSTYADFASVNLIAGHRHTILIEYHESSGAATMQLFWQLPGSSNLEVIPAQRLYAAAAPPTVDLALKKAATQTSVLSGTNAVATLAVDGTTDGAFWDGSVTHTADAAPNDWWQVDLGASSTINWVQLWNRTDCCSNRLQNFVVFVASYDMTNSTLAQLQSDPTVTARQVNTSTINTTIGIPVGGMGRYVRVQLLGSNYLSLAEVEVFGTSP